MTTISERVMLLIDHKKIPKENFFITIGAVSSTFTGKDAKSTLDSTTIYKILSEIPDVNLEWLITGKGEMLRNRDSTEKSSFDIIKDASAKALRQLILEGKMYTSKTVETKNNIIELQRAEIEQLKKDIQQLKTEKETEPSACRRGQIKK